MKKIIVVLLLVATVFAFSSCDLLNMFSEYNTDRLQEDIKDLSSFD